MTAGRDDSPDADLADPADAAGKRPAGRGRRVGEAESDQARVVHRRIPNLPDHTDQVTANMQHTTLYCHSVAPEHLNIRINIYNKYLYNRYRS